jgi:hypothetical protein
MSVVPKTMAKVANFSDGINFYPNPGSHIEDGTAPDGSAAIHAYMPLDSASYFCRVLEGSVNSATAGDRLVLSGDFWFPKGFFTGASSENHLIRWDNWNKLRAMGLTNKDHRGGVVIWRTDRRVRVMVNNRGLVPELYIYPIVGPVLSEEVWYTLTLEQVLRQDSTAYNALYVDGKKVGEFSVQNYWGIQPDFAKWGFVSGGTGIKTAPTELWFKNASISATSPASIDPCSQVKTDLAAAQKTINDLNAKVATYGLTITDLNNALAAANGRVDVAEARIKAALAVLS